MNAAQTDFLYDRATPVQELSGGMPIENMLTGLGIDEYFVRSDSVSSQTILPDGLGSTLALTDTNGTVATEYTYEPFGETTASGSPTSNSFQYTGRENDGTGLQFYRARYYSAAYGRFISEDPIGTAGGLNLYSYVDNDPVNLVDALGLKGQDDDDEQCKKDEPDCSTEEGRNQAARDVVDAISDRDGFSQHFFKEPLVWINEKGDINFDMYFSQNIRNTPGWQKTIGCQKFSWIPPFWFPTSGRSKQSPGFELHIRSYGGPLAGRSVYGDVDPITPCTSVAKHARQGHPNPCEILNMLGGS